MLASSISRQWPATRPGSYTSSIHSMEELLHCYVACSKQSILHPSTLWKSYFTVTRHVQSNLYFIHPSTLWKSYFTVTWHVQSNLYFIHPLYGRVTSLLRGMFKAIYTSSIHSMEELLVTWHVQSNLYFIHPLYGRVTSLLRGMFKAIYTSSIHSMEELLHCYVACSKQSILHPSTLWKSHCYLQCYVAHSKQSLTVLNNCTCSSRSLL